MDEEFAYTCDAVCAVSMMGAVQGALHADGSIRARSGVPNVDGNTGYGFGAVADSGLFLGELVMFCVNAFAASLLALG